MTTWTFWAIARGSQYLSEDGTWGTVATAQSFASEEDALAQVAKQPERSEAVQLTRYRVVQSGSATAGGSRRTSDE